MKAYIYILTFCLLLVSCGPQHNPNLDATTNYEVKLYGSSRSSCSGALFFSNSSPVCDDDTCKINNAFKLQAGLISIGSVITEESWPANCQYSYLKTVTKMTDQENGCANNNVYLCFWSQEQINQFKKLEQK